MKTNKDKPILKVYFINNEYLSSCNICIYNIPKKISKKGSYRYSLTFQKFQLGKHKYNVNVSLDIPEDKYDNFLKYGIMQNDKLSYCEVFHSRETTFCLSIWLYSVENKIIGNRFKIKDDNSFFTTSVVEYVNKKKPKKIKKVKSKPKRIHYFENEPNNPLSAAPTNYYNYMKKQRNIYRANLFRPYQGGSWRPR